MYTKKINKNFNFLIRFIGYTKSQKFAIFGNKRSKTSKALGVLLVYLILFSGSIFSQTHITTSFKDYKLEVFVSKGITLLEVAGQHADINILNWEKDSVSIESTVEILSDKENLSSELLEEIQTGIYKTGGKIIVQTKLSNDFHSTIPYKITYNLFCPQSVAIHLKNEYGSVNVSDFHSGFNADLSYCTVKIQDIHNADKNVFNTINLSFCNGTFKNMGSADLEIKNSDITTENAEIVKCNSAFSKSTFKNLTSYKGNSNIDNITIDKIDSISLNATNTITTIHLLKKSAFLEFVKGKITINNSSSDFKKLTINGNQTPVELVLNKEASYTINGEIKNGQLIHPKLKSINIFKDGIVSSFNGEIGIPNQSKPQSQVIVFNQDQNVEFK